MAKIRRLQRAAYTSQGSVIDPRLGVVGVEETIRYLNEIPADLQKRVLGKAMRSSAKILRDEMYRLAPQGRTRGGYATFRAFGKRRKRIKRVEYGSGALKKSLQTRGAIIQQRFKKMPVVWVGPTKGKYASPHDAWYSHFAEFGTRFYKKKPRGHMFSKRALENTGSKVAEDIKKQVLDYIKRKK